MNIGQRLVLGTAQLGMPYGIANKTGRPDLETATEIVRVAWELGIREFDTAQGYGMSEQTLGEAFSRIGISEEVRVITKFEPDLDPLDRRTMEAAVDESLRRLRVPCLFGVLLNAGEKLSAWEKGAFNVLSDFILAGKVRHWGVTVYSPKDALTALHTNGIDILQLPTNIFDRRFEREGVFHLATTEQKRIYIRSVFLQGLILMTADNLPPGMPYARPVLEQLDSLSTGTGLSRQEIAMGYVKSAMPDAQVVIGAETPTQVEENVWKWDAAVPDGLCDRVRAAFPSVSERILNPSLWL
ncbi:MAG: aldo/keto reductase [Desulfobacteraceae bacterium]|nr:MAG: aldo/keto reductase [Desulfobacteraceae bacterium]